MAWLSGYTYRAKIPVNYTLAGAQTDYQVKVTVYKGTGINSAGIIYLNNHSLNWSNDIRFTATDGTTLKDHWLESSDATTAVFWVELNTPLSGETDYYVYYGKSGGVSASNGVATFLVFDDFISDNWLNLGGASHSVSSGQMTCQGNTDGLVYRNIAVQNDIVFKFKVVSLSTGCYAAVICNNGVNVPSGYLSDSWTATASSWYYGNGSSWGVISVLPATGGTAPFTVEIKRYGSSLKLFLNGVEKSSATHATLSGGRVAFRQVVNRNKVIDDVSVRKYADPEPIWATPGSEVLAFVAPTVVTQAITNIQLTTATGNENITDTGGENCDKRGVCWNIGGNPTVIDSKSEETNSFSTGAFTHSMTGLTPNQKYYVKAYAHNSIGYGYGEQVDFTTLPISFSVKISAIQDELTVFDDKTMELISEDKTFTLDISALSVGRFRCKIEGKGNGRIKEMAIAIVEAEDNIPFTLSSYKLSSESYEEIASFYLQKISTDCDTLKIIVTMEAL